MAEATPLRLLGRYRALVGEGSFWDAARRVHWSVDIFGQALIRTDPTGIQTIWPMLEMAAAVAIGRDGGVIVAMESALFLFDPDGSEAPRAFAAPDGLPASHRFNDLTVDPAGRLIVGTMQKSALGAAANGTIYSYDGANWTVLADGLATCNGLAVAPDGQTLYWSDSAPSVNRIWHAPYDPDSGTVGAPGVFVDMHGHAGRPDGAAVDADGGYWIAAVDGGCLHRFLPDGRHERTIDLPLAYPTKPAFCGSGLDRLLVTTLSIRANPPEQARDAGRIVSLDAGVRGHPLPQCRF